MLTAGIYLHVPFCHAKCAYCDFYSTARADLAGAYTEAVEREYALRRQELGDSAIVTLYFGGGTPSLLPDSHINTLARLLHRPTVSEFTIEANPEDITPGKVAAWQHCGINRVSIGVQSLTDSELKTIRRRHSAADALKAIATIRNGGITNISADLIYGLPGQTAESWTSSLRTLLDTGITHLSAYCLGIEPGTLLYRHREQGIISEAPDTLIEQLYGILCQEAATCGMEHYEISNFALPSRRSRHNSSYWSGTPYLGLGPGAHSLDIGGIRHANAPDLRAYINDPASVAISEDETHTERLNDRIMTALRIAEGLTADGLTPTEKNALLTRAQPWLSSGHLVWSGSSIRIPEDQWLMADAIIRDLFFD